MNGITRLNHCLKKTESEQEERFLFQDRKMENGNKLREKVKLND